MNLSQYSLLPDQFDDIAHGTPATLIGWGLHETNGVVQENLQEVDLIVFSDEECFSRHVRQRPHQSNICGGVLEGGKGQCSVSATILM